MGIFRVVAKLLGLLAFAAVSICAFLFTLVVGIATFMAMIGAGIIALVTFGVIDYRKSKQAPPPEEL